MHSLQAVQQNGVIRMELIKGNLLFFLGLAASTAFLWLWSVIYDGRFRQTFSFYRKKNMHYEWKVMGILLGSISLMAIGMYYFICMLFNYPGLPFPHMGFIVLLIFTAYLLISTGNIQNSVLKAVIVLCSFLIIPYILIFCILLCKIQFDRYCVESSIVLALLDMILIKNVLRYWKEGDFS